MNLCNKFNSRFNGIFLLLGTIYIYRYFTHDSFQVKQEINERIIFWITIKSMFSNIIYIIYRIYRIYSSKTVSSCTG